MSADWYFSLAMSADGEVRRVIGVRAEGITYPKPRLRVLRDRSIEVTLAAPHEAQALYDAEALRRRWVAESETKRAMRERKAL